VGELLSVNLLAPILFPGTYFCAAANYRDHSIAMAKREGRPVPPDPRTLDIKPYHFFKSGKQATVGPSEDITKPTHITNFDWELELGAVIGHPCRGVSVEEALNYVAGYTVCNDLSARDPVYTHRPNIPPGSPFSGDFLSFKGFDKSAIMGPWITPAAQVGNPAKLNMKLWVNDELMQDSDTSQMVFSAAEQISYLSQRITLLPGDVVMTGTPAGTGTEREQYLKAGDSIRMWIENIGEIRNKIV
jgi:2-keto-4-pentenoate hydratase/2-oxohepta-3-ene-1,7-dioic acid hydratase in catechol pathway